MTNVQGSGDTSPTFPREASTKQINMRYVLVTLVVCMVCVYWYIAAVIWADLDCTITADIETKVVNSPLTMLATYPRSGNSYTRWMTESLSGIQTSSMYCDRALEAGGLKGECDHELSWLVKTHYPVLGNPPPSEFQRALVLVRNPFDAILSYYHLKTQARGAGLDKHSGKGEDPTSEELREWAIPQAQMWQDHFDYWHDFEDVSKIYIRYEDERNDMNLDMIMAVTFWLNAPVDVEHHPDSERLLYGAECVKMGANTPYNSYGYPNLHSLSLFDDQLRADVLEIVTPGLCKMRYDEDVLRIYSKGLIELDCSQYQKVEVFSKGYIDYHQVSLAEQRARLEAEMSIN